MIPNRSRGYYLNGKDEREEYADSLYVELVSNNTCQRMGSVFFAPISLLNAALMCFEYGLYLSSVLTCRVVIESALYTATANENMRVRKPPVDSGIGEYIESYNSTKCAHLLMNLALGDLIKEAEEQGIIDKDIDKLSAKLQEKGNIAAHYAQGNAKHFQRWIPKRASKVGIDKAVEEAGKKVIFDKDETKRILGITVKILIAIIEGTNRVKVVE